MFSRVSLSTLKLEDWQATEDPLVYRKELIYVDTFTKDNGEEKFSFAVDEKLIDHWVETFKRYTTNGNKVPVPLGHSTDPEKTRGEVIEFERGRDSQGRTALFGKIKFRDAEAAKLSKTSNVSIYVEPQYKDGKANVYEKPVLHVALTDYPVVPGLEPFQAIAASNDRKEKKMTLQELAAKFGLDPATPAEQVFEAIALAFDELKGGKPPVPGQQPPAPGAPPAGPPKKPAFGEEPEEGVQLSLNPVLCDQTRENRELKIDALLKEGFVTPALAKSLKEKYCAEPSIKLALDHGHDEFKTVHDTIRSNGKVVHYGGRSGPQPGMPDNAVALSNSLKPENNPLIASAMRMAGKK